MNFDQRNRRRLCKIYETFGECKNRNCRFSHDGRTCNTRIFPATIAIGNASEYGNVTFIRKKGDIDTEDEIYIPRHSGYDISATLGDKVELQVSEKVHRRSGHKFGRILRVLTPTGISKDDDGPRKRYIEDGSCFEFHIFNDCKFEERCKLEHRCEADQVFELGEISSVMPCHQGRDIILKFKSSTNLMEKTYLVPNELWYMRGAKEGNVIVFQESSRQFDCEGSLLPLNYGKVLAILQNITALNSMCDITMERCLKHAFAIDPSGKNFRTGGCSIKKCKDHENSCKRIGIHVQAITPIHTRKLTKWFIPIYRRRKPVKSFSADTIHLAISVYAHSESNLIEGPFITPVVVDARNTFTYGERTKYSEELDVLWLRFASDTFIQFSAKHWLSNIIVDYPDTWRERFVMNLIRIFFNKQVTAFLKSKTEFFVIAQNFDCEVNLAEVEVLVPAKFLEGVANAREMSTKEKEFKTATLFGSTNEAANVFLEENYFSDMYLSDVLSCETIPENKIVRSTFPCKRTQDLINQQILLNCIIGRSEPLYSREEVLGMLVQRYETPIFFKSIVRILYNTSVILQIIGIRESWQRCYQEVKLKHLIAQSLDEQNCTIIQYNENELQQLSQSEYDSEDVFVVKSISVLLKGVCGEKYFNTNLATVSGKTVNRLRTKVIESGIESEAVDKILEEISECKSEEILPYESHPHGLKITLKGGVELQLQISLTNGPMGEFHHNLRLLRFGENGHLCLTHLNSPKRAFMCSRADVRELISPNIIKKMKKDITANTLKTITLNGIKIQWKNDHFYGGTFHTNCKISVRCLLCIRKEICREDDVVSFVWIGHGVVDKISEEVVEFLLCSLGQDETTEIAEARNRSNGYIVEVITVEN